MTSIRATIVIDAPIERVFAAFTDLEQMPRHLHEAVTQEFKTAQRSGVGTEWVQTAEDAPDPDHRRVIELIPNQRFAMTSDDPNGYETLSFSFEPLGPDTEVQFHLEAEPKGFGAWLVSAAGKPIIRKMMEADLKRMKAWIEEA